MNARIHRIGVAVNDLDTAVEYYSALFGGTFERTGEAVSEEAGVAVAAHWAIGVELVQSMPGSANPTAQQMEHILAERGEGVFDVGFTVPAMDAALERAEQAGVKQLLPTFGFTDRQLQDEFADGYTKFDETVLDTLDRTGSAIAFNCIDDA
jgi:4-hydroxyphenylpyruvate dioxygenase-like putative hemolysin